MGISELAPDWRVRGGRAKCETLSGVETVTFGI